MTVYLAAEAPDPQAVEICPGVWAVPDGGPPVLEPVATTADVPPRPDARGARAGKRLAEYVPAGWLDATVDVDGTLVAVDAAGDIPEEVPLGP